MTKTPVRLERRFHFGFGKCGRAEQESWRFPKEAWTILTSQNSGHVASAEANPKTARAGLQSDRRSGLLWQVPFRQVSAPEPFRQRGGSALDPATSAMSKSQFPAHRQEVEARTTLRPQLSI